MADGKPRPGARPLKQRVKTAKGRKLASTLWLARQLNDPYVARAKSEGRRSRAAYKLIEIDDKHHLLRPGLRVVDLGAAPGGWSQIAAERVRSTEADPKVVAIDYLDMDSVPGVKVLKFDFSDPAAPAALVAALGGHKADVVLSDLAGPTTGHRPTDHLRIVALVELAAEFAIDALSPGGAFVAKVLQGGTEQELLARLKRHFKTTLHAKPPASRQGSAETYLVANGFWGG
ncbi:MAG: RlmE family RNA methyltransferase [Cucumibacter sp.]